MPIGQDISETAEQIIFLGRRIDGMRRHFICMARPGGKLCGHRADRNQLEYDDRYSLQTLPAKGGHPDEQEPAEHVTICPKCGARESFEETT